MGVEREWVWSGSECGAGVSAGRERSWAVGFRPYCQVELRTSVLGKVQILLEAHPSSIGPAERPWASDSTVGGGGVEQVPVISGSIRDAIVIILDSLRRNRVKFSFVAG